MTKTPGASGQHTRLRSSPAAKIMSTGPAQAIAQMIRKAAGYALSGVLLLTIYLPFAVIAVIVVSLIVYYATGAPGPLYPPATNPDPPMQN